MRRILVTQRLVSNASYREVRDALDIRWGAFLRRADYLAVPAPSSLSPIDLLSGLEVSGVVLSGGNDLLSLANRGDSGSTEERALSAARDRFEMELLAAARTRRIPVLGVCRGAQLLASVAGWAFDRVQGHAGQPHRIRVSVGRYGAKMEGVVNSFHTWAISGASNRDWAVTARSEDNYVEAFEHRVERIAGIMWHPERYEVPRDSDLTLVKEIFS